MTFMFETAGSLVFPDEWKVFWVGGGCILFFNGTSQHPTLTAAQSLGKKFFLHSRYGDGIERPKLFHFFTPLSFPHRFGLE